MDWLDTVATVARIAGASALRHFRRDVPVSLKADGSPVTVADLEAERAAREWILERFPDHSVLGEEEGHQGPQVAAYQWVIDPIDGTKSFIHGVPLWGSMVGVMAGDRVVAGAVCCPALDELVVAADGSGCWHNGARTQVSGIGDLAEATVLATDQRFSRSQEREEAWARLVSRAGIVRTWGDCYGYVLVATGRAEVMVDDRLSLWDYAPLAPIIREAGGHITDWQGNTDFGGDAIATNAALAQSVRAALGATTR